MCEQDDCVIGGHSCSPHQSCVNEHMNYGCNCVSDFQMEVLSRERCAETLIVVGLMHEEMVIVSTR